MARNELLDRLFSLFREQPRWSSKDLRAQTEQPEAYLKEVLNQIADLHRSGEFNGLYELKPNFKDSVRAFCWGEKSRSYVLQVKAESGEYSGAAGELMKADPDEDDFDEDEDDDDDEDMEEIS